ncbi:hypothetical protein M409DRAFT_30201 [Zasmidium cellare ATCC 36951]|uniref:Zn(2)-C6 fungal-type domain-containing protein n=1 Tax=Zasmidium cellare ATCC 36951 TaxID=1080233 RepID=A0A6A6BX92_ZASCE|nr:uncharacterized protein M409DRAFT_30201 [Zasmidium cellare ATCC 36951]KAF2159325.1 hypothetical protein M409DRAFT_30201 [Zasmidium cellare ATCC 36951]
MVGVPRRSRACATCKKRKVACDAQSPCGQCVKAKLKCSTPGGFIFVPNEAGSHRTVYKKGLGRGVLDDGEESSSDLPTSSSTKQQQGSTAVPPPARCSRTVDSNGPALPKQMPALKAVRQQLVASFISRSDPTAIATANPHNEASMLHSWYNYLFACSTAHDSLGLSSGALACYTAFFGRRDNDLSLIDASRRLYAESLGRTQRALRRRETALRDETLAACLSLVTYETLECPAEGLKGYWWHSEGCLKLVELRGPAAHREGPGKVLFEEFRLHGTLDAFRRHRPNFLSSPAWMSLSTQNESRSDTQKILDIFLLGPAVLQKADNLALLPLEERFPLMLSMIDDLWDIDDRLSKLESDIKIANQHHLRPIYWEQPAKSEPIGEKDDDAALSHAKTISIHFTSVPLSRIISFLWAIQCMVWPGLVDLYTGIIAMGGSPLIGTRIPSLGHRSKWIELVWKITQSMEYWESTAVEAYGPVRAALQFNVVIDVMKGREGCDGTLRWAEECRERIGRGWLRILRFEEKRPGAG